MSSTNSAPRNLERAIDILLAVARGDSKLASISESVRLPPSTAHRLLLGLAHRELIAYDDQTREYRLGPGCIQLAAPIFDRTGGLGLYARTSLDKLRDRVGHTATLHARLEQWRVCLCEAPSLQPLRYVIGVGAYAPLWTGASGRVLLAFGPQEVRERAFEEWEAQRQQQGLPAGTDDLRQGVENVLKDGWAGAHGEVVRGAAGISVPIVGTSAGGVTTEPLALSVIGPELEIYQEKDMILGALYEAAEDLKSRRHWKSSYVGYRSAANRVMEARTNMTLTTE